MYEVYYKDICLGILKVDTVSNRHAYTPYADAVQQVKEKACLIREMVEGTDGFVAPIPFFQNRLMNMKRNGLSQLRYHTDYFGIKKCHVCDEN